MYKYLRFPGFKIKAITLSYDDGMVFDKKLMEICDRYGLKCTFNLNSELFSQESGERRLTKEEASELYSNTNHEVAIHGARHLSLTDISPEEATREVICDRENLEKQFGKIIKGMAYAYGAYNDTVIEILKNCGVKYARTVISTARFDIPTDWLKITTTCHHAASELNDLIDEFLSINGNDYRGGYPALFYLWGHSYEFNDFNNWYIIEDFAKKVGNRDDIWYCTNGELYDYVKAYEGLEYSVDGRIVKNNTNIDVYLCYNDKDVVLKAGSSYYSD